MRSKIKKQSIQKKSTQSGFGLVEVIVSITIMTMVMVALHYVSASAYYNWENAQNKVVAYNLIQQEIEKLHNLRDTNSLTAGKKWDDGINDGTTSITPTPNVDGKEYNIGIIIESLPADNVEGDPTDIKKKITVEAKWQERLGERTMKSITYLTDWKPRY